MKKFIISHKGFSIASFLDFLVAVAVVITVGYSAINKNFMIFLWAGGFSLGVVALTAYIAQLFRLTLSEWGNVRGIFSALTEGMFLKEKNLRNGSKDFQMN
jgi:hypothetical protein